MFATRRSLAVRTDDLLVSQPDHGEQALEIAETLVRSGALDLVVIDSVAALVPKAEIEGDMGDSHMGLQARLMSQALRKLTGVVHRTNTTLFFINQIRHKIGVMFGSPRDDNRRQRSEVLLLDATRCTTHWRIKSRRRNHRKQNPGQGRQKQNGTAISNRRIRHSLRPRHRCQR